MKVVWRSKLPADGAQSATTLSTTPTPLSPAPCSATGTSQHLYGDAWGTSQNVQRAWLALALGPSIAMFLFRRTAGVDASRTDDVYSRRFAPVDITTFNIRQFFVTFG